MYGEQAPRLRAAVSLLDAVSGLDASLVPADMIEQLASRPGYLARSCAAGLLLAYRMRRYVLRADRRRCHLPSRKTSLWVS